MAIDGPVRSEASPSNEGKFPCQVGYLAGSKAMESLDKFITSTESFFHPSNSGLWSLSVRKRVVSLFCARFIFSLLVNPIPPCFDLGVLQALA